MSIKREESQIRCTNFNKKLGQLGIIKQNLTIFFFGDKTFWSFIVNPIKRIGKNCFEYERTWEK